LSPQHLEEFLSQNCELRDDGCCWNKFTNRRIAACLVMHTFGFPAQLDALTVVCRKYNIELVEDAAESLGSFYKDSHTGSMAKVSAVSFNGNKIITTGGGGMILTNDALLAKRAKHLTTTAKVPHKWDFEHDEIGYNYRLPNLNAALGVAQMEKLPIYLEAKRELAKKYFDWGKKNGLHFIQEPNFSKSNFWLNAAVTEDEQQRNEMLEITNKNKVMTRPSWRPMHLLDIYKDCETGNMTMTNTEWFFRRLVCVPSGVNENILLDG